MKMTIYLPDQLAEQMKLERSINWSKIAQQAFADRLGLTVVPREPTKIIKNNTRRKK